MKPIGLLGGTFDPIHFGHLRTAIEIHDALQLSQVRLIPCYQPVHRSAPAASAADRLAMVKCAIANEPALTVDDTEITRPEQPSWTIDTLEMLRTQIPDTPLCLIMGADVLLTFPKWRRFMEILKLVHIIVAHRPGYCLSEDSAIRTLLQKHQITSALTLHSEPAGGIFFQSVTPLEISATEIRRQFAAQLNPRYLLPDAVCDYIRRNHIYETFDGKPE